MALNKQNINVNFLKGLDTKTDPWQVAPGNFLSLQNTIFTKGGLLQKRNGYTNLTGLSNNSSTYLTTLNDNLTAIGTTINAYNSNTATWVSKGAYVPVQTSTLSLIKNNANQEQCDSVVAVNGLMCTVYTEYNGSATSYKYVVADSTTGQNIISPIAIPVSSGTVTGSARVFLLGNYFIVAFTNVILGTSHLQYIAINTTDPQIVTPNADLASAYVSASTLSWDGFVANNNLYFAYNTTTGGQSIKVSYLTTSLGIVTPVTFSGHTATMMSVTADVTDPASGPRVYVSFYNSGSSTGYSLVVDKNLNTVTGPQEIIASGTFLNLTSAAQNGSVMIFGEVANNYSYDSSIPTHYIDAVSMTEGGTVGSPYIAVRSVGLASKAFIVNDVVYFLAAYQSTYQPTYFLMNGSTTTAAAPVVVAKLAYENGGGYLTLGLPSVLLSSANTVQVAYLYKDLIAPLNTLNNTTQTTAGGIYSQTGIDLATFVIGTTNIDTSEIGSNLNIGGGFGWMYDGYLPVEQNFFLWPDSIEATWSATGGSIHAQPDGSTNTDAYYYQVTYEWSDNQGNIFRSAPSIPVAVTTTGSGTAGSITVDIPTVRLTYKTANPVKIVLYRWSVANQTYYQVTSITTPQLNNTTSDSVAYVDTLADASVIGNSIIYTTGGVVEDVNPPGYNITTLFDTRQWVVDAEDQNLLWFSKQIIEGTPVEFSDLFTLYIAPNAGTTQSTGPITALSVMDDKLIIFKKDAIYYINGSGPDNTGQSNNYSQPIFITSVVGCTNQQSIVYVGGQFNGLMFQSDKGIYYLDNGSLTASYIGAAVEQFNASTVQSAVGVPATNQVRFTLSTGQTLMYDYYYGQWGTFVGVPAISSCIFESLHTFINSSGQVYQENPGTYLDGSNPVLISFKTGWFSLEGLSGYERLYDFILTGTYYSPHKLVCQVAYNLAPYAQQQSIISPDNYNAAWGAQQAWGQGNVWGGTPTLEQYRVQANNAGQQCQSFQISIQEIFDSSWGVPAGAGLTLSGLNIRFGAKKGARPIRAAHSVG